MESRRPDLCVRIRGIVSERVTKVGVRAAVRVLGGGSCWIQQNSSVLASRPRRTSGGWPEFRESAADSARVRVAHDGDRRSLLFSPPSPVDDTPNPGDEQADSNATLAHAGLTRIGAFVVRAWSMFTFSARRE